MSDLSEFTHCYSLPETDPDYCNLDDQIAEYEECVNDPSCNVEDYYP